MIKKQPIFGLWLLLTVLMLVAFAPKKSKILIIGDSISIGYTPYVKTSLSDKAEVKHNIGNAQHTGTGFMEINKWLGKEKWDVIQFNWGLWDLCYRHPDSKEFGNRDKINGKPEFTVAEYASNLDSLVTIIKLKSNAKLIFVTTTYVPENEPGRIESEVQEYNEAAKIVMNKHDILVNDIYQQSITIHNLYGMGSNNVHYKEEGYKELGELISDFLEKQLK